MKRRWRPGDPDRRRVPRDVSQEMERLAREVLELAADLRRIAAAVRTQEVRRGR